MITKLTDAYRRRLARLRGADTSESGFVLIFVLLVTTVVTIVVTSTLVAAAGTAVPAANSQDTAAATAAAQGGIDDWLAALSTNCPLDLAPSSPCTYVSGHITSGTVTVPGADGAGTETYVRTVENPGTYPRDGFMRIKSTGKYLGSTKTLIADVVGANPLLYAYISKYETLGSSFLNSYYGAPSGQTTRSVAITNSATASAANLASPALATGAPVTWTSPSSSVYDTSVCDRLWYADGASQGRSQIKSTRTGLPTGTDWDQTGSNGTNYQPCEVTFTSNMKFNGPVYTRDAPYFSYGTANAPATAGPVFVGPTDHSLPPVSTGWSSSSSPSSQQLYRSFPQIGGAPSSLSTPSDAAIVQHTPTDLELPSNADSAQALATCVYTGPTRITVSGSTATIMSPLTPIGSGSCYTNTNALVTGSGVTSAQVSVANTLIYVRNLGTSTNWNTYASSANPLFSLSTLAGSSGPTAGALTASATDAGYVPATGQNPTTQPDGAFSPQWTSYSAGSTCSGTAPSLTDLAFLNCYVPKVSHTPTFSNAYSSVKYAIQSALAANPTAYASASAFGNLVESAVSGGNSADGSATNPTHADFTSHRWQTSAVSDAAPTGGCTPGLSTKAPSQPVSDPSTDAFLTRTGVQGTTTTTTNTTTTCLTATVTLQVGTCNVALLLGVCVNLGNFVWGNGSALTGGGKSVAQFTVTASIAQPTVSTNTTATTMSFPNANDRTQYPMWDTGKTSAPGDVYIEGSGISAPLSVVAAHDVVVTGKLTTSGTTTVNSTTGETEYNGGGAVALVADNNVRVYHPVSCVVAPDASTSAGWCPNDITGLYSGLESGGTLMPTHPAMQYCNLTAATTGGTTTNNTGNTGGSRCASALAATGSGPVSEIDGVVFALGGSLLTDNYNRAVAMSSVTVDGGVYQLHRGATGEQWETQSSDGTRASAGYTLQDNYVDMLRASLPFVPSFTSGTSGRVWNVVSITDGGS